GGAGGGIIASVEDREFGYGRPGSFDGQHLFASVGGRFENADTAGDHDVEPLAGLAFGEEHFAGGMGADAGAGGEGRHFRVVAGGMGADAGAGGESVHFRVVEGGEEGGGFQDVFGGLFRHTATIFA